MASLVRSAVVAERSSPMRPIGAARMATAKIVSIGPSELELVSELYNEMFTPHVDGEFFRNRFRGRHNVTTMVAMVDDRHVGFIIGFELMPTTFFSWVCGVLPDFRRMGISTQLMQAQHAWAFDHAYNTIRFECIYFRTKHCKYR